MQAIVAATTYALIVPAFAAPLQPAYVSPAHTEILTVQTDSRIWRSFPVVTSAVTVFSEEAIVTSTYPEKMQTLEEAYAEWADESLEMANEAWYVGTTDTRER